MARKRHSAEEIVTKLRQVDVLTSQGRSVAEAVRSIGVTEVTCTNAAVLTPQTVSVIIANLERGGSLVRRPHAVHGRIQHIDLNEKGKSQLAQCRKCVLALERELVDELSSDDAIVIRRWLVGVATAQEGESAGSHA